MKIENLNPVPAFWRARCALRVFAGDRKKLSKIFEPRAVGR